MSRTLPTAEVVRKYIDAGFDSNSPVLVLSWPASACHERLWEMPEGFSVVSAPPQQFGFQLRRLDTDQYDVRLVWDRTQLHWPAASRTSLLGSCLGALLGSLRVDLWSLLEQPVHAPRSRPRAA
ncbi:MAG: hypothetical protein U0736_12995 [Gemmataceae bacterium]